MEKETRLQHFDLNWDSGGTKSEKAIVGFLYKMGGNTAGVFNDGWLMEREGQA